MNGQEKISVIIPVYNAEKYLKFCIESVLDPEIELILIDDGSTDQSAKIIEEYRNTYPHNIKTVFQQNGGVSKARNAGIQISTGRWILFLDADDYLTEDGVKTIKAYAKSDKNIVIFSSQRVLDHQPKISQGSHAEKNCITSQELMNHALRADGYSEFCSQHDFRSSCAKLIKKELLINYRFDTNIYIGEDFVFMLELYAASISNMVVDSAVYCYYVNVNSAVHSYHKGYSQNVMRVNKRIEQILRSNKSLECNDIKESFDLYKMNDLILLLKYDYFNSKNDMVWKARKKTVEDIINLFDFERLYQTIQREGNLTRIPKEKRIIYRLLFLKIYYPVYAIFRIKYGEK